MESNNETDNEVICLIITDENGEETEEINLNDCNNYKIKLEINNGDDVDFKLDEEENGDENDNTLSEEDSLLLKNIKVEVIDDPAAEFGEKFSYYYEDDADVSGSEDNSPARKRIKRNPLRAHNTDKFRKLHCCNICGYTSHQKSHYRRHLTIHFKPEGLRCSICKKSMLAKSELTDHMEEHRCPKDRNKFKCHLCNYFSYKLTNVSQHTEVHFKLPEERLKCDECNFTTKTHSRMIKHKMVHSGEKKNVKCPVCLAVFENMLLRRRHIQRYRSPNDPNKFQCPECPYTNERFNNFKQHMVVHRTETEIDMFQCSYCPFRSKRKTDLRQHVNVKHKNDDEVLVFKCDFCSYETRRGNHLTSHMRNRHKKQIIIKKCGQCSYRTVSQILIDKHLKIHSQKPETLFLCSICGHGCQTEKILLKHMSDDHANADEDDVDFTWRIPDKDQQRVNVKTERNDDQEPSYSFELVKIKREIESEEETAPDDVIAVFCCQFQNCDFATETEIDIKLHHTICHGRKGDDNKCPKCTFHTTSRFTFLDHLRVHMIDVEHLKPHLCEICGSRWIRQGDLTRHMSVHWDGDKPKRKSSDDSKSKSLLKCAFCKYETKIRLCLYKHMLKHDKEKQIDFSEYVMESEPSENESQ